MAQAFVGAILKSRQIPRFDSKRQTNLILRAQSRAHLRESEQPGQSGAVLPPVVKQGFADESVVPGQSTTLLGWQFVDALTPGRRRLQFALDIRVAGLLLRLVLDVAQAHGAQGRLGCYLLYIRLQPAVNSSTSDELVDQMACIFG